MNDIEYEIKDVKHSLYTSSTSFLSGILKSKAIIMTTSNFSYNSYTKIIKRIKIEIKDGIISYINTVNHVTNVSHLDISYYDPIIDETELVLQCGRNILDEYIIPDEYNLKIILSHLHQIK